MSWVHSGGAYRSYEDSIGVMQQSDYAGLGLCDALLHPC